MIYNKLQVFNYKINRWEMLNIGSVFTCDVVSEDHAFGPYYGIHVGVRVPCVEDNDRALCKKYVGDRTAYLLGIHGEKVPIDLVGSDYNLDSGEYSCCLFGYITPDLVAPDKPPVNEQVSV